MKKYTNNTRVGLLIALLSFNALFACVNTRQGWGILDRSISSPPNSTVTGINYNQTNSSSANNYTSTTTGLLNNMTTEKVAFILNATYKNPTDLVPNGTRFDLAANETSNSDLKDIKKAKDLKLMDKKIAEDLVQHKFSEERLNYWLDQELDPNTIGPTTKASLLGALIVRGKIDEVRLLLTRGANPNIEDGNGLTPLLMSVLSVFSGHLTEDMANDMINLLIGYGADPCIKNNRGSTMQSCIKDINVYFAYKEQWDKVIKKLGTEINQFECPSEPVQTKSFC